MALISNDEDLGLFVKDFARLLNKYHYAIDPFKLRKITTNYAVCGFRGSGGPEITPEYFELTDEFIKLAIEDGILEPDYEK